MIVMKFGGTSVKDSEAVERLIRIVERSSPRKSVVVVSALAGVTDTLIRIAELASGGKADDASVLSAGLEERHLRMAEQLLAGNESLLNDQINQIMKTLTIFSVIILPLNLIAAIFGMNTIVGMPFINNPHGFWYVVIIMMLPTAVMLLYFKRKHWL